MRGRAKDVNNGAQKKTGGKIWIDLDNSPHVLFFRPVIRELQMRGHDIVLTARECFQVCGLADRFNMSYRRIGRHYGRNTLLKVSGLLIRSLELLPFALEERPGIALSHGSRSQILSSKALNIPSVLIYDYEHSRGFGAINPTWSICPEIIKKAHKSSRTLTYPGIKEDVYVPDFRPADGIRRDLGVPEEAILVTIRPPASEANYRNPESERLFDETMDYLFDNPELKVVVLPRNEKQKLRIIRRWTGPYSTGKMIIPGEVVDGLNLIWHSDMIISGGGTMNREAAALGAPVYSIFRGETGAVDRYLAASGRLTMLASIAEVRSKLKIEKWEKPPSPPRHWSRSLEVLINNIEAIIGLYN